MWNFPNFRSSELWVMKQTNLWNFELISKRFHRISFNLKRNIHDLEWINRILTKFNRFKTIKSEIGSTLNEFHIFASNFNELLINFELNSNDQLPLCLSVLLSFCPFALLSFCPFAPLSFCPFALLTFCPFDLLTFWPFDLLPLGLG